MEKNYSSLLYDHTIDRLLDFEFERIDADKKGYITRTDIQIKFKNTDKGTIFS